MVVAASAAVALAAAVGVTIAAVGHHHSDTRSVPITSNSLAVISDATDAVAADVPVGADPGPVAVGAGSVWVGNRDDDTLTRLGLPSYQVKETYGLGQPPVSVSVSDGHVWIGLGFAGTLSRILVKYNQLSAPFAPAIGQSGLLAVAATGNNLWVGLANDRLLELNPANLQPRISVGSPGHVFAVGAAGDAVWTLSYNERSMHQLDPLTGRIRRTVALHGQPQQLALGNGSVWVTTDAPNRLWRVESATGKVASSVSLGATPTALAVGGGDVWVAADNGTLEHLRGTPGSLPTTIHVGHTIGGLAVSAGSVLMSVDSK